MHFAQYNPWEKRAARQFNNEAAADGGWLHSDECNGQIYGRRVSSLDSHLKNQYPSECHSIVYYTCTYH